MKRREGRKGNDAPREFLRCRRYAARSLFVQIRGLVALRLRPRLFMCRRSAPFRPRWTKVGRCTRIPNRIGAMENWGRVSLTPWRIRGLPIEIADDLEVPKARSAATSIAVVEVACDEATNTVGDSISRVAATLQRTQNTGTVPSSFRDARSHVELPVGRGSRRAGSATIPGVALQVSTSGSAGASPHHVAEAAIPLKVPPPRLHPVAKSRGRSCAGRLRGIRGRCRLGADVSPGPVCVRPRPCRGPSPPKAAWGW